MSDADPIHTYIKEKTVTKETTHQHMAQHEIHLPATPGKEKGQGVNQQEEKGG